MKNEYRSELQMNRTAGKELERKQEKLRKQRIREVLKIDRLYSKQINGIEKELKLLGRREAILLGRLS
jgi:hypothetical protein